MRIRTIKPEFWQSEDLAEVSDKAKLLAIGLLNMADDEGYLKSHPAIIKSQLFPFTEESLNIHGMLTELSNAKYLTILLGSDGKEYVLINNFTKHQKVNRPSPSKIRASVEFTEHSLNTHGGLTIGKERKGTGMLDETSPDESTDDAFNEAFEFFWKNWRHCKTQIGLGKNYGVRKEALAKFKSKYKGRSAEFLKAESEAMVNFMVEVYGDILEHKEVYGESIYRNYETMYPQKFIERRGWDND